MARHDGLDWRSSDSSRQVQAGEPLGFRCVPILIKGDWSEHWHTLGLPQWNDAVSPCCLCRAERNTFHNLANLSPARPPHPRKDGSDYERACKECEIVVEPSAAELEAIRVNCFGTSELKEAEAGA